MAKIRSTGSKIEREFMTWHREAIPHPDWLPYRPDFVENGAPVYIDSTFWHGYISAARYARMAPRWVEKIFRNIVRDVIRFTFWMECYGFRRYVKEGRGLVAKAPIWWEAYGSVCFPELIPPSQGV